MTSFSAPQNLIQQGMQKLREASERSAFDRRDYSYGVTGEVDLESHRAKVFFVDETKDTPIQGKQFLEGDWLPVVTQQSDLFYRWGKLRSGMLCKVWWQGQHPNAITMAEVEIIGDEDWSLNVQEDKPNEISIGPYKIFGGGME